jgi:hypothetical protein
MTNQIIGPECFTANNNLNPDKPTDVKNWNDYRPDGQLNQQMQ